MHLFVCVLVCVPIVLCGFILCIESRNHYHNKDKELLHFHRGGSVLLTLIPHPIFVPWQPLTFCYLYSFVVLRTLYTKWNHTVCNLWDRLILLCIMRLRSVYSGYCMHQCLGGQSLYNHSPTAEHLSCFHYSPIMNKAAVNMHAKIGIHWHSLLLNPAFKI